MRNIGSTGRWPPTKIISHEKWYWVGCDKVLLGCTRQQQHRIWEDLLATLRPPEDCQCLIKTNGTLIRRKKKNATTMYSTLSRSFPRLFLFLFLRLVVIYVRTYLCFIGLDRYYYLRLQFDIRVVHSVYHIK